MRTRFYLVVWLSYFVCRCGADIIKRRLRLLQYYSNRLAIKLCCLCCVIPHFRPGAVHWKHFKVGIVWYLQFPSVRRSVTSVSCHEQVFHLKFWGTVSTPTKSMTLPTGCQTSDESLIIVIPKLTSRFNKTNHKPFYMFKFPSEGQLKFETFHFHQLSHPERLIYALSSPITVVHCSAKSYER